MAQNGNAEDTTAEFSRIFLGIQIQCAQCHNHPTDRWKREQFHELAAFFPRISVRPVREGEKRSFAIVSMDRDRPNKGKKPRAARTEHFMPDLNHPEEDGQMMQPVFFLTGQQIETGTSDRKRRGAIGKWMTSSDNQWFAKAYVNRMWAELIGRGFYEAVDDLGPDRTCSAPRTLDALAEAFVAQDFDVKWLMSVIMATDAYQRESQSRESQEQSPFSASCPQRLRADQLYNALIGVLEIEDDAEGMAAGNPRAALASPRARVNRTFGYDPSTRRDEVVGSIPQALYLMNAPELSRAINGRQPDSLLGRLLAEVPKDEDLVEELYLKALSTRAASVGVGNLLGVRPHDGQSRGSLRGYSVVAGEFDRVFES